MCERFCSDCESCEKPDVDGLHVFKGGGFIPVGEVTKVKAKPETPPADGTVFGWDLDGYYTRDADGTKRYTHDVMRRGIEAAVDAHEKAMSSYYRFSNGVEVADISEHLTGNGAQALQYIARSCRIDGNNKGERLLDLEKAVWFCEREIERLKASGEVE